MIIQKKHLSDKDHEHVFSRLKSCYNYLDPKIGLVGNVRASLKHDFPSYRFSVNVRGANTKMPHLIISWVNYADINYPSEVKIKKSLRNFLKWTKTPILLDEHRGYESCEIGVDFFHDLFGYAHSLECIGREPSDEQKFKREEYLASKLKKKISIAIGLSYDCKRKKRKI